LPKRLRLVAPATGQNTEFDMSLLRNTSVRTILAAVFLVLALGLCTSLGWQLYDAWEMSVGAARASALAAADKAVFQATYAIHSQRTELLTAIQAPGDLAKTIEDDVRKAQAAMEQGIAAVEATPGFDAAEMVASIHDRWNTVVARSHEVEALARGGLKERDRRVIEPLYDGLTKVLDEYAKLSFHLSSTVRMTDPTLAEFVQARQLAWVTRETAGRECGTARPFINRSTPLTQQAHDSIVGLRAQTDVTLAQLVNMTARRGVAPELSKLVGELGDIITKGKTEHDALYSRLDGSNKPLLSPEAWTAACSDPMNRIYQVAWLSFDLMIEHVARVESAATWRLRLIGAALVVSAAFCAGALMLIRRRIAAPVAELTKTIDRLAQRKYDEPVARGTNRDEFGLMSERLEALRMSGIEAERLAADQIASKDADLERAATMQAECRQFETSISKMLDAVDAAGTQMTTMANTMAATAQQTAGQSSAAAAASELASSNVKSVSAATGELAESISEIGRRVSQAAKAAGDAVHRAKGTSASIERLSEAAQKIGDVVELINAIAGQTNLLALNATIEAARAGEAGKGFAVVATEVKSLAAQTAKATEDVTAHIKSIQQLTREAVTAIRDIGEVITQIDGINATIASAIEEQDATTHAIAGNVQDAANGTAEVSRNIAGVSKVAESSGKTAAEVLAAAQEVSAQAGQVRARVETFVRQIQAA
jgi:methyl-accepting chemotaxis protein